MQESVPAPVELLQPLRDLFDIGPRGCDSDDQVIDIVIGRGGKAALELDLDAIRADGAPVFRRRGGG